MGTGALMSIGVRAMFANYAALQTTGHNIANANNPYYSRQQVELESSGGQFTGAGFFGKGVDIAAVTRSHDQFLTREAALSSSLASMDKARFEQLQRLELVFPTGERGIGHAAGQFLNAMVDMANTPQDPSARAVVLSRASEVAARFSAAGSQIDSLQQGVTQDLRNTIQTVNALAARIADVNHRIVGAVGNGQTPNDLLDLREQLVAEISEHVQVSTVAASDGSLGVFIGGGQRLVLGNQANELAVTADPEDSSRSAVGIVESGGTRPLASSLLGGGSIAGLLRFQNEDLVDARNMLGQMAVAFAGAVNQQQSRGIDLNGAAGGAIFAPGVLTPQAASNASQTGSVGITITNPAQVQAREYSLSFDGTDWTMTDPRDPTLAPITFTAAQMAAGYAVPGHGITVGPTAGTVAAGDRFLLQPVGDAANLMRRVLDDPRGLAAASPASATRNAANTGTATVGALAATGTPQSPVQPIDVRFSVAAGVTTYDIVDAGNTVIGTGTWTAGQPIDLGNGFSLALNGVPAAGDRFAVGPTTDMASNNGNALAFTALRDRAIVNGDTMTDAYAAAMSEVGVRVQTAKSASQISTAAAASAEQLRSAKAGVNLDEEAARLIQFQQSYQAAAKVLQVAQSIFDTLLQTAAG